MRLFYPFYCIDKEIDTDNLCEFLGTDRNIVLYTIFNSIDKYLSYNALKLSAILINKGFMI